MLLHELDAFLAIVYARGAHKATTIRVHELWNRLWAIPNIISQTMVRNRFIEIMRFLRFDYKQTRSHRLATDKMGLISTVKRVSYQHRVATDKMGLISTVKRVSYQHRVATDKMGLILTV